jgi:hypothetical protein
MKKMLNNYSSNVHDIYCFQISQACETLYNYHHINYSYNFRCLVNSFEDGASEDTLSWYGELVRSIERKFPNVFDRVSSSVLSEKSTRSSKILKTLLGAGTSRTVIFQQLIHPNPDIRIQAIEHISKHFNPDQVC